MTPHVRIILFSGLLREVVPHCPAKLRRRIISAIDAPAHRPRQIDREHAKRLRGEGKSVAFIANELNVTRQAIYKAVAE